MTAHQRAADSLLGAVFTGAISGSPSPLPEPSSTAEAAMIPHAAHCPDMATQFSPVAHSALLRAQDQNDASTAAPSTALDDASIFLEKFADENPQLFFRDEASATPPAALDDKLQNLIDKERPGTPPPHLREDEMQLQATLMASFERPPPHDRRLPQVTCPSPENTSAAFHTSNQESRDAAEEHDKSGMGTKVCQEYGASANHQETKEDEGRQDGNNQKRSDENFIPIHPSRRPLMREVPTDPSSVVRGAAKTDRPSSKRGRVSPPRNSLSGTDAKHQATSWYARRTVRGARRRSASPPRGPRGYRDRTPDRNSREAAGRSATMKRGLAQRSRNGNNARYYEPAPEITLPDEPKSARYARLDHEKANQPYKAVVDYDKEILASKAAMKSLRKAYDSEYVALTSSGVRFTDAQWAALQAGIGQLVRSSAHSPPVPCSTMATIVAHAQAPSQRLSRLNAEIAAGIRANPYQSSSSSSQTANGTTLAYQGTQTKSIMNNLSTWEQKRKNVYRWEHCVVLRDAINNLAHSVRTLRAAKMQDEQYCEQMRHKRLLQMQLGRSRGELSGDEGEEILACKWKDDDALNSHF